MLLEIEHLKAFYGKAMALEDITMGVERAELVAVLGPNGAGKTTLLKAISRTVQGSGKIELDGVSLQNLPAHAVVGHGVCHCPEGRRLFGELTARKNLLLGAYLRNDREAIKRDYDWVLNLFPVLHERGSQVVSTMSGGQQQMVAIGRALMGAPKLLLLDEPSVGIAHKLKQQIFEAICAIRDRGVAILMAEQDALSALKIADRVYVLEHGKVAQSGTSAEMRADNRIQQIYLGVE